MRKKLFLVALALLVAACVAVPTRNDEAAYTQALVQDAIRLYNREGIMAAIDHYSAPQNVDGPWYIFIIDGHGYTIAHHNPEMIGRDPALRVDVTGYFYGDDLLSATEAGKWISYVFNNPETGAETRKHAWVVRHDGLFFGSGWYEKE